MDRAKLDPRASQDLSGVLKDREIYLRFSSLITTVVTFIWVVVCLVIDAQVLAIPASISSAGALAAYVFARRQKRVLASHLMGIFGYAGMFLAGLVIPPAANFSTLLVIVIANAFLYFQVRSEFKYALFYTALGSVLWGLTLLFEGTLPGGYAIGDDLARQVLRPMVQVTLLSLLSFQFGFFAYIVLARTEVLIKTAQEARAAGEAKANFLATMSHELRTPLNGVIGMIEMASRTDPGPEQKSMLSTANDASFALLDVIDDILDTTKLEAGKLSVHSVPVEVRSLVDFVIKIIQPLASEAAVELKVELDESLPNAVATDPVRLRQVLINILGNAVKFSDREDGSMGERVTFEIKRETANDRDLIVFVIRDRGIGMNGDTINRLFSPFMQSENAIDRRFGGTGLGLSISKGLIDLMGGTIDVKSELGKGSEFCIKLPIVEADVPQRAANQKVEDKQDERQEAKRVLLVEDNEINQKVLGHQLAALGYEYECAINGKEGLTMWREGSFDLVLSDCHMPVMNGFEMTHAIRFEEATHTLPKIPIVAVTANALQGEAEKCHAAGMDDYLSKPVKLDDMNAVLSKWVNTRQNSV